jgi:hypothetical protein
MKISPELLLELIQQVKICDIKPSLQKELILLKTEAAVRYDPIENNLNKWITCQKCGSQISRFEVKTYKKTNGKINVCPVCYHVLEGESC